MSNLGAGGGIFIIFIIIFIGSVLWTFTKDIFDKQSEEIIDARKRFIRQLEELGED